LQDVVYTDFPIDRQAPEDRAAKKDGASAKGQSLEDICPTAHAAIDVHFAATCNGLDHFGQGLHAGDDPVELTTAVVGDNNTGGSIFQSQEGIFRCENAFEQDGKLCDGAEPGEDLPGELIDDGGFLLIADTLHERGGVATAHRRIVGL
jgi:hypothetical protein